MGSRAAYVIRKEGVTQAYGSHWGASSIMDQIFWGPDHATAAFSQQEELDEIEEIDGGDEGTVLVDWDARKLLWWAANCEHPVSRRIFNKLVAANWPGWSIDYATGSQSAILSYLGIAETVPEDEPPYDDEELEEDGEVEPIVSDEDFIVPSVPADPVEYPEELAAGYWVSIKKREGKWVHYLLSDVDEQDLLNAGPDVLEQFAEQNRLSRPVPEIAVLSGTMFDQQNHRILRWQGSRYPAAEKYYRTKWTGYEFTDLPEGWLSQTKEAGQNPEGLAADERILVGAMVSPLMFDGTINPSELVGGIFGIARKLRLGCLGFTILMAAFVAAAIFWIKSNLLAAFFGMVLLMSTYITYFVWKKSRAFLQMESSLTSTKEPFQKGLTAEEKRPVISNALVQAGYPSLEELETKGEIASAQDEFDEE